MHRYGEVVERATVGLAASSWSKRGLDVVVALAILIVVSPVTLMMVGMLRCTRPGPMVICEKSLGLAGRRFNKWCWAGPKNQKPQWGDRLLAQELSLVPTLFNVLIGDMAIVGPQARTPEVYNSLAVLGGGYEQLLTVRPGVIGVGAPGFQLSGRAAELRCELHYVENWRFLTDLVIIVERALSLPFIKSDHHR